MNQTIEPEFQHEVRANVAIAKQINNRVMANVKIPANFERSPVRRVGAANEQQPQSVGPTMETIVDEKKVKQAKAVYDKFIRVVTKMGFPEEQGSQLCQLLTETMIMTMEEEAPEPGGGAI